MRPIVTSLLLALLAAPSVARGQDVQIPLSAWLQWRTLSMVMKPDSSGVWWWAHSFMAGQKDTHFTNYFDPGTAQAWVGDAKGFLSQKLSDTDTGTVRTSPVLTSFGGDGVYLARRKDNGRWSNETFIVMETLDNGERVLVNGDEKSVAGILDTLLAVSRRTNFIAYAPDSLEIAEWRDSNREEGASARPDNLPPAYPDEERTVNHEGRVLLSFVVGEDGRAEMGSVKVLYATSRAFLRSVIKGLQPMRFNAATVDGKPVRQRVTMPFEFSLMR